MLKADNVLRALLRHLIPEKLVSEFNLVSSNSLQVFYSVLVITSCIRLQPLQLVSPSQVFVATASL